jgi:hypothetical protein
MRKLDNPELARDFRNRWLLRWTRKELTSPPEVYLLAGVDHRKSATYIKANNGSNLRLSWE